MDGRGFYDKYFENVFEDLKVGLVLRNLMKMEIVSRKGLVRLELEYGPTIECGITDEDMILLRIDWALDAGDEELFGLLAAEL